MRKRSVELALLPKLIDSHHPAGDSTLVTAWDTVLALLVWVSQGSGLEEWAARPGAFNYRVSLSAGHTAPMTHKPDPAGRLRETLGHRKENTR